jgi:hypothetical protein
VIVFRFGAALAGAGLTALALAACNPAGDVGYVEIKTVPVAPVTVTLLYLDSTKLDPIKKGTTILRQQVGTLKLQASGAGGLLAPLCEVVVKKNRITTVTVSVLGPPRCQCRFSGGADKSAGHTCVS